MRGCATIHSLDAFFADGVNVAVLRRLLSAELAEEACRFAREPTRVLLTVDAESKALHDTLPQLPALASDISRWVEVLADLTGCERVGVRLARVESAMCPRFHVDVVSVRVVVTYLGRGTEYIASEDVDRRFLGHAARGASDETSGLVRPFGAIGAADPGDVVLLKGESWPGNRGGGAVHRSPPASAHEPRLVLTLDAVD